jgi:iron complex outermembrane recepter protein
LLDRTLPAPVDPRINLTRQPWSVPGVFNALTGSVRLRQELDAGWQWTTQYGAQRLKTDDRLTYGFGYNGFGALINPSDPVTRTTVQFTKDGKYEIDDYRSDNERRFVDVLQTEFSGQADISGLKHQLNFGVLRQRQLDRLPPMQTWQTAGEGSIYGGSTSTAQPAPNFPNTNRSEYSNEFSVKDRIELENKTSVWMGLRNVSFNRESNQNVDSNVNARRYEGSINLPWLGISKAIGQKVIYASHGHGVEQFVAPNTPLWISEQAGQQLGIGRSRQTELGVRTIPAQGGIGWNAALFQIERPLAYDEVNQDGLFVRHLDGKQTHQGLDLGANLTTSQWRLGSQIQWLHAKITDVTETSGVVGSRPLNVPQFVLRGMAEYRYSSLPGLRTGIRVSHEGERNVTEDGSVQLPAWTIFDATAHYDTKLNNVASTWTLAIENLEDKRYWRESPKQFGHYYLYPGAPRTFRATVQFRI